MIEDIIIDVVRDILVSSNNKKYVRYLNSVSLISLIEK